MTCDELLTKMEEQVGEPVELYGRYMRSLLNRGFPVDKSSLISGRDLLEGRSILFNDPFYYDLIPYAFYAMNHTLLRHRKVLIVLGRHSVEEDIIAWCQEGLHFTSCGTVRPRRRTEAPSPTSWPGERALLPRWRRWRGRPWCCRGLLSRRDSC